MTNYRLVPLSISALILGSLAMLISGCYIASVHPIASPDQRVFDKELLGVWASGRDTVNISGETVDNLKFEVTEAPGALSDSVRIGSLGLLVTNIEDQTFMDVRPSDMSESDNPIMEQMLMIPMHAIIRYTVDKDTLSIQYLNYTEFNRLQDAGKLHGLEVEDVAEDGPILITSPTAKIRDFLADHKHDEQLYADPINYVKVKQ